MDQKPVNMSTWPLVRRLWQDYIHNYKSRLFAAMGLMVVIAACTAGFAKLIEPILNQIFIGKNQAALWPVGIAVLLVFAIRGCANYGEEVLMSSIGQSIVRDLQDTMFRHIIHMDLAFFQSAPIGTLISRFTFDVNNLRHATSTAITGMGKSVMTIIFLVGLLFYQDPFLATLSVFIFPLTFYPIVKLGKRMRKVAVVTQGTAGFYTSLLEQIFNGIRHVKAYHAEVREILRAENMTQTLYRLTQKSQRVRALGSPIMEIFGAIAIFIIIIYGGHQVISGQKSAGEFFSFITALLLAYEPLKDLSKLNAGLQEGLASAQRIYTLLALAPELQEAKDAKELKLQKGEIKFTNVEFAYDTGVEALRGINLVIPAGKTVALVGTSGSGKTTILNMIPRFYDVKNGAITIDQQDVRELTFKSLREKIALVSQETILFDDTIKANIAYGRPSASMDDIVAAAKNAGAHDFGKAHIGFAGYYIHQHLRGIGEKGQRYFLCFRKTFIRDHGTHFAIDYTQTNMGGINVIERRAKTLFIRAHIRAKRHIINNGGIIGELAAHGINPHLRQNIDAAGLNGFDIIAGRNLFGIFQFETQLGARRAREFGENAGDSAGVRILDIKRRPWQIA
jgi:subfamily B ATP-binding cassette protein MsbA